MAVTDNAIEKIKSMIVSGQLAPGDRLPPEKQLSEHLGLSRSSLREAVKALELVRVLDVRQGDGTYVTSLEPALLLEAVSFVTEMQNDSSVLELFEVRRILEPQASALASGRISAEDLSALQAMLDEAQDADNIDDLVAHDLEFHSAIVRSCGNAYLLGIFDTLSTRTQRARIWRGLTQQGAVSRTLAEHQNIINALKSGDAQLVAAVVLTHIVGVEDWIKQARID